MAMNRWVTSYTQDVSETFLKQCVNVLKWDRQIAIAYVSGLSATPYQGTPSEGPDPVVGNHLISLCCSSMHVFRGSHKRHIPTFHPGHIVVVWCVYNRGLFLCLRVRSRS